MTEKLTAEARNVLEQLWHEHCGFSEIAWFFRETDAFFSAEHLTGFQPELIVLGEDFPPELAATAGSLYLATGHAFDREMLLAEILNILEIKMKNIQ